MISGMPKDLKGGAGVVPGWFVALVAIGLLALAPVAQGRTSAGNALDVTFTADGVITMTLPDGTPVGTTSGAPTVIPAGSAFIYLREISRTAAWICRSSCSRGPVRTSSTT